MARGDHFARFPSAPRICRAGWWLVQMFLPRPSRNPPAFKVAAGGVQASIEPRPRSVQSPTDDPRPWSIEVLTRSTRGGPRPVKQAAGRRTEGRTSHGGHFAPQAATLHRRRPSPGVSWAGGGSLPGQPSAGRRHHLRRPGRHAVVRDRPRSPVGRHRREPRQDRGHGPDVHRLGERGGAGSHRDKRRAQRATAHLEQYVSAGTVDDSTEGHWDNTEVTFYTWTGGNSADAPPVYADETQTSLHDDWNPTNGNPQGGPHAAAPPLAPYEAGSGPNTASWFLKAGSFVPGVADTDYLWQKQVRTPVPGTDDVIEYEYTKTIACPPPGPDCEANPQAEGTARRWRSPRSATRWRARASSATVGTSSLQRTRRRTSMSRSTRTASTGCTRPRTAGTTSTQRTERPALAPSGTRSPRWLRACRTTVTPTRSAPSPSPRWRV